MTVTRTLTSRFSALLAFGLLIASAGASAATITVDSLADPGSPGECTLRKAILNANAGTGHPEVDCAIGVAGEDTIVFDTETAGGTIELDATGQLVISEPLIIDGSDPDDADNLSFRTRIDAGGDDEEASSSRIFEIQADTTLNNLFLTGGRAVDANGGAILVTAGAIALDNTDITNSQATGAVDNTEGHGGAIYITDGSSLTRFANGTLDSNLANQGGGAIYDASTAGNAIEIVDATFSRNTAGQFEEDENGAQVPVDGTSANGGALYTLSGAIVTDDEDNNRSVFENNVATGSGGGIWIGANNVESKVINSFVGSNAALGDGANDGGGNIYLAGGDLTLQLATVSSGIANGEMGSGGGILATGGSTLNVSISAFSRNYATASGGAIALTGTTEANFDRTVFAENGARQGEDEDGNPFRTDNGGALHAENAGTVTFNSGSFTNNVAGSSGGAVWSNDTDVSLTAQEIRSNGAFGETDTEGGGALYNGSAGRLTVDSSRLIGNGAVGDNGSGGAILNEGALLVRYSDINRNSAEGRGAGIAASGAGGATVVDCNGEPSAYNVCILRSTVGGTRSDAGNMTGTAPGLGGGVFILDGSAAVFESLVAFNTGVQGGGLWNGGGTLEIVNSTISNNQATGGDTFAGNGGGVYQGAGGSTNVGLSSVVRNSADGNGGGVSAATDSGIAASGSIIAENSADGSGNNFVNGNITINTSINGSDAGVEGLKVFGGPTPTHPLDGAAAAVDHANSCGVDTDQRGAARPGNACDAGAFERTDDPVIQVSANGPTQVGGQNGEDLVVLAFQLSNDSGESVTVDGFRLLPLFNAGYQALFALLPAGADPEADFEFEIVRDDNGDGVLDESETDNVLGADDGNGVEFTFTQAESLANGSSENYLVVFRTPATETTTAMLDSNAPIYAGGMLLALLGIFRLRGLRRRTQWVLAASVLAVGLTACSNADELPGPPPPPPPGDAGLQGQVRFKIVELHGSGNANGSILIGDGLPLHGPAIFTQ